VEDAANVTVPFATVYVPSFAMVMVVFVHVGEFSTGLTPHNFNVVASIVPEPAAESFARGETDWLSPF
jgi:hypothetical protein